jgi:hypothetical protein
LHVVASHNTPTSFVEARRRSPFRADQGPIGRMKLSLSYACECVWTVGADVDAGTPHAVVHQARDFLLTNLLLLSG